MTDDEARAWDEYDLAARCVAIFGELPDTMSGMARTFIDEDPEAFDGHVRATAYAIAMGEP